MAKTLTEAFLSPLKYCVTTQDFCVSSPLALARMCFRAQVKGEMERERLLLAYQVNDEVQQGHFPVNKELALEVAALMAQVRSIFIRLF